MSARWWRWVPWVRRAAWRRHQDALRAAKEWQAEQRAARDRIIDAARRNDRGDTYRQRHQH